MYPNYFGLKEPSFSITPDPQYLFLSEQHREALAHLLYGAGESGGFVLLTGEVGTGKTTVCRAFLEQLPEGVDVALILNPAMTVTELLRAVCEEFRIPVPEGERTVKALVDRINGFLLEAHAAGRRPVLMIDEAQNLKPRVLEQIRLLTNLETTKHKLLQIFLVGQPELRVLLQREGLRQLDQRITARYHLQPFSARDTAAYIRHRLAVAGVERMLFTPAAMREVHRRSKGVPRVINILCDRALLGAFVRRSPVVTPRIVARAAKEVRDERSVAKRRRAGLRPLVAAAAVLLALALGWFGRDWSDAGWLDARLAQASALVPALFPSRPPAALPVDVPEAAAPTTDAVGEETAVLAVATVPKPVPAADDSAPEAVPRAALAVAVEGPQPQPVPSASGEDGVQAEASAGEPDREPPQPALVPGAPDLARVALDLPTAVGVLLRRWGLDLGELTGDPCARVAAFGLLCERGKGDWQDLFKIDRPALVQVFDDAGRSGYAVVGAADEEAATLDLPEGSTRVTLLGLSERWTGEFLVVWQPPPFGGGLIGPRASGESVRWLRKMLSQVPDVALSTTSSGRYDRELAEAVRLFQAREGLVTDGLAGPRTLIRLNDALAMPGVPRLLPES